MHGGPSHGAHSPPTLASDLSIDRGHFRTFPSSTYIRQVTTFPSLFSFSKHFSPSPFFFFSANLIFPFQNIFPCLLLCSSSPRKTKKFFFYYTDQIFSSSKYFHLFSISVLLFPCRLNVLPLLIFPSFYSPLFFFSAGQMFSFSFSRYILPSLFFFHSANQIFSFSKYFPYFPSSSFFSSADSLFAQKLFKYFNYCKQCQQCQQCKQYKSFIGAVLSPFLLFFTMIMPFISILETSFWSSWSSWWWESAPWSPWSSWWWWSAPWSGH